jgi:oxaloacetate decarboxylase gamma subunit
VSSEAQRNLYTPASIFLKHAKMLDLLSQGVELMLVGMGTVFIFLSVLILAMQALALGVERFTPVAVEVEVGPTDEEVAAITVALARHGGRVHEQ